MTAIPTLLLSPDESRDRNGPVTPTLVGTVSVVDGQYENSQAWMIPASSYVRVESGHVSTIEGTAIIRFKNPDNGDYRGLLEIGSYAIGDNIRMMRSIPPTAMHFTARTESQSSVDVTVQGLPSGGTWATAYLTWDAFTFYSGIIGGDSISGSRTISPSGIEANFMRVGSVQGGVSIESEVESVLIYPVALTDPEIQRIGTMDEPWRWAALMPKIGGVLTTHSPAPFAVRSTHEEIE